MMASDKNVNLLSNVYTTSDNKKKFVVSLYGCFGYTSPITYNKRYCPLFCPIAMVCTPSIIGTIYSRLNNEEGGDCLPMGKDGFCCCLINYGIAMTGPCGGSFFFGVETLALRKAVIQKYNVHDDDEYCFGSKCLGSLHLMCNYPCALFQMAVSLEEWHHQQKLNESKIIINQPTPDKGINI